MKIYRLLWCFALAGWFLAAPAVNAQGQSDSAPAAPAASDANAALPTRVRVSSGVMGGLLLKKVAPHYPEDARQAHIQGTVVLHALISRTGDIADLQLVSGPPELTNASMKAVRKWKYKPYLLHGQPVEVETTIQVNFTLSYR